jgi:hypothetical protein
MAGKSFRSVPGNRLISQTKRVVLGVIPAQNRAFGLAVIIIS